MPRVLIADEVSEVAVQAFAERGIEVSVQPGLAPDALAEIIGDFEGLVVRSATRVTAELVERAARLKVVGRAGTGVDNVDMNAATKRGIVVMNTPHGNSVTAAEHTIAMMCALARRIPQADRSTRKGGWERGRFMGVELRDKTLGVVGCGTIGAIVATLAQGLRMRVVAFDPYLSPDRAASLGVTLATMDELLGEADVITLHVPLTDETRGIIDAEALAKTRPGVRIVNCARGGLVVEADLKSAIESGHVAGAALDVFEEEPARDNALFAFDEVIATPHLGASTVEAQENVALQIAQQMAEYLLTDTVVNAVNAPSVSPEEMAKLGPYLTLAEQIGSFAGQIADGRIRGVTIAYEGQASALDSRLLTAAALQGMLAPRLDNINIVNAPFIARERGISVREVRSATTADYQTLVRVEVLSQEQPQAVAGTLIGRGGRRIVEVEGIEVEAELGPHMLYFTNEDRPGLIGAVATILGEAGINIATFNLGRREPGGDAIGLIGVDSVVPDDVLAKLRDRAAVIDLKRLNF
ncbi:MAG: phosphoglycerate dehydrogenase [Rhodospirillales bacterium]|nr:phosphoglycerate dehydrogenase [Rhodospirillales bacterium]